MAANEPQVTVETLQRLLDEERLAHEREYSKLKMNYRLEQMSRMQWEERARVAEAKIETVMQVLGIR